MKYWLWLPLLLLLSGVHPSQTIAADSEFYAITAANIDIAACRAKCIHTHAQSSSCSGECSDCWDFCAKLVTSFWKWAPICKNASGHICGAGCKTACSTSAIGKRFSGGPRPWRSPAPSTLDSPMRIVPGSLMFFHCQLTWSASSDGATHAPIVFAIFGLDRSGRWHALGHTHHMHYPVDSSTAANMASLRLAAVSGAGLLDVDDLSIDHERDCLVARLPSHRFDLNCSNCGHLPEKHVSAVEDHTEPFQRAPASDKYSASSANSGASSQWSLSSPVVVLLLVLVGMTMGGTLVGVAACAFSRHASKRRAEARA